MKNFLINLLISFFFLTPNGQFLKSVASTNQTYYAKIENNSIYFYSLPIKGESYKLFEIPESYFVLLYGEENQSFYKAKYSDLDGYVLKESVAPIIETPNYPFAQSKFRVFSNTYIYSSPYADKEALTALPALSQITTYYGEKLGDELIPSSTNIWYYCSFVEDGLKQTGYVFSYYCDQFQEIQQNSELVTKLNEEPNFTASDDTITTGAGLSGTAQAIIIIVCILPCLVILLLLLKKKAPSNSKHKPALKRRRRKDYYEFSEDDI